MTNFALFVLMLSSVFAIAREERLLIPPDGLYLNLSNQRMSFYSAVITCRHVHATLVMPQWQSGGGLVPFSRLWDADHLLAQAAADGISILLLAGGGKEKLCTGGAAGANITVRLQEFKAAPAGALCPSPEDLFSHFMGLWKHELSEQEQAYTGSLRMHIIFAHSTHFARARKWLRPAKAFRDRAQGIVAALTAENEKFSAVHLRTEGDFEAACRAWPRIDDLQCLLSERETAEELERQGVERSELLFVFPRPPPDAVPVLCGEKFRCIFRGEVDPGHDLGYNELALLDYSVALHGVRAFGNIYSTMSVELVASMQAEGKRAAFLNAPCRDPASCP